MTKATIPSRCFCGRPIADDPYLCIPLCEDHYREAYSSYSRLLSRQPEWPGPKYRQTVKPRPVVYYVTMNDHVKIGTTKRFTDRMRTMYVQPRDVLAVEPGGRTLDKFRRRPPC